MGAPRAIIALGLVCLAIVGGWWIWERQQAPRADITPAAPSPPARVIAPPPLRPVPVAVSALHAEIGKLQASRQFQPATELYPRFLAALEQEWGSASPDLAPYVYNFALALRLAGEETKCIAVAQKALGKWPETLQLGVLEALARTSLALAERRFDGRAHQLFEDVLVPENQARLLGLRLQPVDLYARWAELLFSAQRHDQAARALAAALALDPRSRHAGEIAARVHLAQRRPREALQVAEALLAEKFEPNLALVAGAAQVELGQFAAAWDRLSRLLEAPALDVASRELVRLRAARALNELGRGREALRLLVGALPGDVEAADLLQSLARAARAVSATAAASALERRMRAHFQRERWLELASSSRGGDLASSSPYYEALVALETDRVGEAMARLKAAHERGRAVPLVHLELARVRMLLGLSAAAEAGLREGLTQARPELLMVALAAVIARRGRVDEARGVLADARSTLLVVDPPGGTAIEAGSSLERSAFVAWRALACLDLGDADQAARLVEGESGLASRPGSLLPLAELRLLAGKPDEARELLAQGLAELPGGRAWAKALQDLMALRAGAPLAAIDISDLLDHPRLFLLPSHGCPPSVTLELGQVHSRRLELVGELERAPPDVSAAPALRLNAFYREVKAARKAREVAWYALSLRPKGLDELGALAATLTLPEESLPRLQILDAALGQSPGNQVLQAQRLELRRFFGLEDA